MTVRAVITTKEAWMGTEFGENFARKHFSAEVIDALPRNVKGKNKDKFKTTIQWIKVEKGGWVRDGAATASGDATGHVENRVGKVIAIRIILRKWGQSGCEVLAEKGETYRFRPDD